MLIFASRVGTVAFLRMYVLAPPTNKAAPLSMISSLVVLVAGTTMYSKSSVTSSGSTLTSNAIPLSGFAGLPV